MLSSFSKIFEIIVAGVYKSKSREVTSAMVLIKQSYDDIEGINVVNEWKLVKQQAEGESLLVHFLLLLMQ